MEVQIAKDHNDFSIKAAQIVSDQLLNKPESVIVFPTGNTPLGMFKELVSLQERPDSFFKILVGGTG